MPPISDNLCSVFSCLINKRDFYRRVTLLVLLLIFSARLDAQINAPDIIPPSPSTFSIFQADLSPYTGQPNISIPLEVIKLNSFTLPVTLNYSGSQGVRVQEIASWCGLGWSLSANGAISRTIRGLADDKNYNKGYWSQPELPVPASNDFQYHADVANGEIDAEPDIFYYSVAGMSGKFLINKDLTVIQMPLTNRIITPHFEVNSSTGRNELVSFIIKDERGNVFEFSDHYERSWSQMTDGPPLEITPESDINTWYIKKIYDFNEAKTIEFFYETYAYDTHSENHLNRVSGTGNSISYYKTQIDLERLTKITCNDKEILFNTGLARCDLKNDQFLDNVEIMIGGQLSKKYKFHYSYFDENGVVAISEPCDFSDKYKGFDDGNHHQRLRLDSLQELGYDDHVIPPYRFFYNEDNYLPSRFSYARDHWGYYNGQANSTLEPRHHKHLPAFQFGHEYNVFGEADRRPYLEYAKAGVMERLIYPTGGESLFQYELHEATNPDLIRALVPQSISIDENNPSEEIEIKTYDRSFASVTISSMGLVLSEVCNLEVIFTPNDGSAAIRANIYESGISETPNPLYFEISTILASGEYDVSFAESGWGSCPDDYVSITVKWDDEEGGTNRKVGGLRLQKMTHHDAMGNSLVKDYQYVFDKGFTSSGFLASVPEYGYAETAYDGMYPVSWVRTVHSNVPFLGTSGSNVGYARVEIINRDKQETGKKVLYYTNPQNYPNLRYGYFANKYDEKYPWQGEIFYSWMPPEFVDMDWMRGLLRAEVDYGYSEGIFYKMKETINSYRLFFPQIIPLVNNSPDSVFVNAQLQSFPLDEGVVEIRGIKAECTDQCSFIHVKSYDLFTGRYIRTNSLSRLYHPQSSSENFATETSTFYENPDYYFPTREVTENSKGLELEQRYLYPFDKDLLDLTTGQEEAIQDLLDYNCVSPIVKNQSYSDENLLEEVITSYKNFPNGTYKEKEEVFFEGSGNPSINYEISEYNSHGRIVSWKDRGGIIKSYIYANNDEDLAMEAQNAEPDEILHMSFDQDNSITPYTGLGCTELFSSYNITSYISPKNGESYILGYMWKANANDSWELISDHFPSYQSGQQIITSKTSGYIDELRFYPAGSLVKTFYYDQGNRLTEICDYNFVKQEFNHDSHGRLKFIKDKDQNILQSFDYNLGLSIPTGN